MLLSRGRFGLSIFPRLVFAPDENGTNTQTPPTSTQEAPPPQATAPQAGKTYTEAEWNAMAANYRKTQDDLKKLQDADKARQDAEKTEAQREKEAREAAERRAAQLERDNHLFRIGHKHGIPEDLWSRIQGATPEELEADALKLKGFLTPPQQPGSTGQAPGAGGGTPPAANKVQELEAQLAELRKANAPISQQLKVSTELQLLKAAKS